MLEKLNNINFNNISNNPNLGIEIGREIQNASWVKSPFFSITGTGADRGVRLFSVANQQPFRPRIKAQLTGSGVSGNTDFEANYDNLEILSQTIYPDAFGNSLRSKIKAYSELERIDFIKESVDSLTTWMNEERDKRIVASLTNDFTNYIYNQKMDIATIRKAIFHARNGLKENNAKAFPIKPVRASMQSVGNVIVQNTSYIILLDSYQANQLKADSEFKELRKLYAFAGEDKGMLYSGLLGVIDNCPVIDAGVWNKLVDIDPSFGVMKFIKTAKGRSSRILRQEFNHLKTKLPTLWTNSCFISTVGGAPLNVVKQYIENQQNSNRPKQKEKWKSYVDNLQTKAL
ncbi:IS200/IS605 family transposase [Helicobacter pylori]|nr:IS200/IS605 family transposase [Helicobacter pylori]